MRWGHEGLVDHQSLLCCPRCNVRCSKPAVHLNESSCASNPCLQAAKVLRQSMKRRTQEVATNRHREIKVPQRGEEGIADTQEAVAGCGICFEENERLARRRGNTCHLDVSVVTNE